MPSAEERSRQRAAALLELTPDSLVERPDRVFFRSDPPDVAENPGLAERVAVEAVGATYDGKIRMELRFTTTVDDVRYLTPTPFVVLKDPRGYAPRGDAWRTQIETPTDETERRVVQRSVPILPADAVRLAGADSARVLLNGQSYPLPEAVRRDLQTLLAAAPSLPLDTSAVRSGGLETEVSPHPPSFAPGYSRRTLQAMLRYPDAAKRRQIQGRVMVSFLVLPDGSVAKREVVKSVHPLLDAEARRVIGEMSYRPGRVNGWPVVTRMTVPVTFRLSGSTTRRTP